MLLNTSTTGDTLPLSVSRVNSNVNDLAPGNSANFESSFTLDAIILGVSNSVSLFKDISSKPLSTKDGSLPLILLADVVLTFVSINVSSKLVVCTLGVIDSNIMF